MGIGKKKVKKPLTVEEREEVLAKIKEERAKLDDDEAVARKGEPEKEEEVEEEKLEDKKEEVKEVKESEKYSVFEYATETGQGIKNNKTGENLDINLALRDLLNKVDKMFEVIIGDKK